MCSMMMKIRNLKDPTSRINLPMTRFRAIPPVAVAPLPLAKCMRVFNNESLRRGERLKWVAMFTVTGYDMN
ncbi:hypothetical protein Tcan_06718 [Toxocara canis]|uniref:Uncharacterized protein n=1 Tax=Toxocara canis TaxID=6265 RepID=A0A0B2VP78_TOXCA|nr:hypothetical protein Tcan_06718 [Toxocara canis]